MKVKDKETVTPDEELEGKKKTVSMEERKRRRNLVSRLSHEKGKASIKSGGRWCQHQQ